jgi:RNA polymerase sigma factor (sigma-70 family)
MGWFPLWGNVLRDTYLPIRILCVRDIHRIGARHAKGGSLPTRAPDRQASNHEEFFMAATETRATLVLDLFDLYYERVYAFLRKSTTPDVAEDLSQEVFVRLLQHPDLESLTISISYLLKIAHNLLKRRYQRATRLRELLEERANMNTEAAGAPTRVRQAPEPLSNDVLETALGLLGKDEQDAIRLIVCEGKSYQHAAESLGVSVTTINNWKHRGIVKLRKLVEDATACADAEGRDDRWNGGGRLGRTLDGRQATGRTRPSRGDSTPRAWPAVSDDVA